ncbi:hypothetical protein, partial [Kibdelosporangium philippinense]
AARNNSKTKTQRNNPTDAQLAQALRDVLVENKAREVPAWDGKSWRPLIHKRAWREIDNVTVNIGQRLHNLKKNPTARVGREEWDALGGNGYQWLLDMGGRPLPDAAESAKKNPTDAQLAQALREVLVDNKAREVPAWDDDTSLRPLIHIRAWREIDNVTVNIGQRLHDLKNKPTARVGREEWDALGGNGYQWLLDMGGRPLPDAAESAKKNPTDAQLAQALRDVLVENKAREVPAWDGKSWRPLIHIRAWREIDNVTVNIGQRLHDLKKNPTARVGREEWDALGGNGYQWLLDMGGRPLPDAAEPAKNNPTDAQWAQALLQVLHKLPEPDTSGERRLPPGTLRHTINDIDNEEVKISVNIGRRLHNLKNKPTARVGREEWDALGGNGYQWLLDMGGRPLPDAAEPAKKNPTDAQLAQALRDVLVENKAHEVPAWDGKSWRPLIHSRAWREIDNVRVNIGQRLQNLKKKPTARVGREERKALGGNGYGWLLGLIDAGLTRGQADRLVADGLVP